MRLFELATHAVRHHQLIYQNTMLSQRKFLSATLDLSRSLIGRYRFAEFFLPEKCMPEVSLRIQIRRVDLW